MMHPLSTFLATFNTFTPAEIQAVIDHTEVTTYEKGTTLLREGEIPTRCYFILQGCVREYKLTDGTEHTIAFYTEHQAVISYTGYLEKAPSAHYYSCIENCQLLIATREGELALHKAHPRLEFLTHTILQKEYQQMQQQLAAMTTYSAEERYRQLVAKRPELLLRVPHHYIASFLGITPESLSRIRKRIATTHCA